MYIRNFYSTRSEINGQMFDEPSLTVPDLSYSIKQLVTEFQVGQLPTLNNMQFYLDEDDSDENLSAINDMRFADKADAYQQIFNSNKVTKVVFEKVKKMREFNKRQKEERQSTSELGE
ncbi:MAG: hypothetical protein ACI4TS_03105 [Bacteroidaceae bacterium]